MKASAILVCPVVPLRQLPPAEVDVIRRFLFQHMRGMDRRHDRRWRRLWGQVWQAPAGEGFQLFSAEERGGPFHRRHRVLLQRLFDAQESFDDEDLMHDWLKLKCWFVVWVQGKPVPRSTKFDECSENSMHEFHQKFVNLLHKPWVQRRFWPHLKPAQRVEMVDAVLARPEEDR